MRLPANLKYRPRNLDAQVHNINVERPSKTFALAIRRGRHERLRARLTWGGTPMVGWLDGLLKSPVRSRDCHPETRDCRCVHAIQHSSRSDTGIKSDPLRSLAGRKEHVLVKTLPQEVRQVTPVAGVKTLHKRIQHGGNPVISCECQGSHHPCRRNESLP